MYDIRKLPNKDLYTLKRKGQVLNKGAPLNIVKKQIAAIEISKKKRK
jgi:hypothetical protein